MNNNVVWIDSDDAVNILDPPCHAFYNAHVDTVGLYLIAGKESFCISVVCPWTTYFCYSFPEVNRCLATIADTYYGGLQDGRGRYSEKG